MCKALKIININANTGNDLIWIRPLKIQLLDLGEPMPLIHKHIITNLKLIESEEAFLITKVRADVYTGKVLKSMVL